MLSFVVLGLAAAASAATFNVTVGDGGPVYKPNSLKGVKKGDIVSFTFVAGAHSVSQSGGVDAPCVQLGSGFDSNFATITSGPQVWELTIDDDTKPIWFYCKQATHCQSGMAGVINPASDDAINTYITNAKQATAQQTPALALKGVGASATKAPAPAEGGNSTAPPADGSSAPPSNTGTGTPPGSSNTPDGAAFSQSAVSAGAVAFALVGAAMFL